MERLIFTGVMVVEYGEMAAASPPLTPAGCWRSSVRT